jgi:hypothetical protein
MKLHRFVVVFAASSLFISRSALAGYLCNEPWNDYCPPSGGDALATEAELFSAITTSSSSSTPSITTTTMKLDSYGGGLPTTTNSPLSISGCLPYSPPLPPNTNYTTLRQTFIQAVFGSQGLPTTIYPDQIIPLPSGVPTFQGCYCAYVGGCNASSCSYANNMTKLVFETSIPINATFNLTTTSTVYYTLNTSGVSPINYPPMGPPEFPSPLQPAQRLSDILVLMHDGHNSPCSVCSPDFDGVGDFLNELGYDVMRFNMPGIGCNTLNIPGFDCSKTGHEVFAPYAANGVPVLRFFLEPVIRAINYATTELGYKQIVMMGLSGGGWTTVMAAAVDTRLSLTIPIAGSIPCDFAHTSYDFEQWCNQTWFEAANYTSLYVLAGLEQGRASVQVLHEQDPCCFHACNRHDRIRAYNEFVHDQIAGGGGAFGTVATIGNKHEVNLRDKTVVGYMLEKLRTNGVVTQADIDTVPFNAMREW